MPYPTYIDSTGATRSVKTVNPAAAGTNADPDINSFSIDQTTPGTTNNTTEKWVTLSAVTTFCDNAGSAPTLKALANAALQITNAYDNTANLYAWMNLQLTCVGASAFTAGGTVDFWIIPSIDGGTTYADGGTGVVPARAPDGYFWLRAVATAQVLISPMVQIPPTKFKILVRNSGGQAFTANNADNTLSAAFN